MVLGQETNGWAEGGCKLPSILMEKYESFFNDGVKVKWKGPFWNETKRFIQLLKVKYPEQKVSYTYNNVVKIGKSSGKGFPGDVVYKSELENLNVLQGEISILNPNLLLFFSGPNYDCRIKNKLQITEPEKVEDFELSQLSKFFVKVGDKKILAFRTYHPRALYDSRIAKREKTEYLNAIVSNSNNLTNT